MDRIEELRQKLETVGDLSLEELQELDALIVATFDAVRAGEIEGVETDDLEVLSELTEATQTVRTRGQELQAKATEDAAKIADLESVVKAGVETEEVVEDEKVEPDDGQETEVPPVVPDEPLPGATPPAEEVVEEAVEEEVKTPLPALAAAAARRKTMHIVPAAPKADESPRILDLNGRETDLRSVAQQMADRRMKFNNHVPKDVEEMITMASFPMDIPEDRTLRAKDSEFAIQEKINAVTAGALDPGTWSSLTASGGFCAPLATTYEIEVIAGSHRPVRDALPRFGADRGGLRFRGGISITAADALGSTGQWTNTTDITPGVSTKATGTINCDTITEVSLYAVYRQLKFGNLRQRADAEGIAAWTEAVGAAWARKGDTLLLDAMSTASTAVSTDAHLGFARDFLHQLRRAAATYRSRNRMVSDAMLRIVIPQWLPDAIATDWLESQAAQSEFTAFTQNDVLNQIRAMNINPTLYADTVTGAGQVYGAQGAHDLLGWKSTAVWFMFHEGAFLFLDGGTLDLGLVRDSTLNNTNDVKMFAENFEAVAFVGVESLKITSNVAVNGTAALAKDNSAQTIS